MPKCYSKSNNAYTNQCTDDTEVTLKRNPKTDGLRHWQKLPDEMSAGFSSVWITESTLYFFRQKARALVRRGHQ
jgi:hypothetical protein